MKRRTFLRNSVRLALSLPLIPTISSCGGGGGGSSSGDNSGGGSTTPPPSPPPRASTTTLAIPPLVTPDGSNTINLQANDGTTEFYTGVSSVTKGFVDVNNDTGTSYLGPTIRVSSSNIHSTASGTEMVDKGTQTAGANNVNFSVMNNTSTTISAHWHGLHVDGFVDGGPYNSIAPGATWSPTLPIYQQASTNWYHTHIMGTTAENVYRGLAGMFIIDDTNSAALDAAGLPSTYGVDDVPLIVQDKVFVNNVMDTTGISGRFAGDTFMVNGVIEANLDVEAGLNRFRILNASNSRTYNFSLVHNSVTGTMQKIATDGGFLAAPVTLSSLRMAAGERNEVVVDFSAYEEGDVVSLVSTDLDYTTGLTSPFTIMTFTVIAQTSQTSGNSVPATLNANLDADRTLMLNKTPDAYVAIDLPGNATPFASGRSTSGPATAVDFPMNPATANFVSTSTQTSAGYTEEWTVTAGRHPFHLHGCSAMIKSIGGNTTIPAELQGWKDVFDIDTDPTGVASTGSPIVFMVQFNERAYSAGSNAGPAPGIDHMYMMHCHILGHEDAGMMGVFEVI